jgi:hypothetical protein
VFVIVTGYATGFDTVTLRGDDVVLNVIRSTAAAGVTRTKRKAKARTARLARRDRMRDIADRPLVLGRAAGTRAAPGEHRTIGPSVKRQKD